MKQKTILMIILFILALTFTILSQTAGETYVLIMGAGDYRYDGIISLPAAKKDALSIKETFIELGIASENHITYIEDPVLTDIKIGLIDFFGKGNENDRLIVYFSGHSEVITNEYGKKDTYLCGIDVRKNYIHETAFNFKEHFEELGASIKAKETLMIFDTCYAGGLTKERSLDITRIENKSFEAISQSKGINFLFSAGPNETSQEIGEDKGGWYTYHLIEGLKGDANFDGDDYITLEELSTYVQQKVQQATKNEQNPMSMIVQHDIIILRDQRKKFDDILKKMTDAYFEEELPHQHFQRFGKILKQKESEDTEEESSIRQILLNYNTLPTLGIEYVILATEPFFQKKSIAKRLSIETTPHNVDIYIDDQYKGSSPLTIELEEGIHTFKAIKSGYKERSQNITIETGTSESLHILMEKKESGGILNITSDPSGANIYINDSFMGVSPIEIEGLELGTYTIRVAKKEYQDMIQNVTIETEERETLSILLEREEATGSLCINSDPEGAEIYIDGIFKGVSPKTLEGIKEGYHLLEMTSDGYHDKIQNVKIEEDKTESVSISLIKGETKGSVFINSNPIGVHLYIDGNYIGTSPKEIEGLKSGYYELKITKVGYEDKFEMIRVKNEEKTIMYITLEEISTKGILKIQTVPVGVEIYIDEKHVGISPKTIELETGTYTINLAKDHYQPTSESVTIESGKKELINLSLKREEAIKDISVSDRSRQVLVKSGSFQMGSTQGDDDEKPVHTVKLTYDFYIGKYEVTFNEFDAYCEATGKSKPIDRGDGRGNKPVIYVTWWDAIEYCNWLSEKEGFAKAYDNEGNFLDKSGVKTTDITKVVGYRLPTEAEWEYAAKGGHESKEDYQYAGSNQIDTIAWYMYNSSNSSQPVGQKLPNELGLYDMSGNVWEWCHDWYDDYPSSTQTNPIGPSSASRRVFRSGSWLNYVEYCRVANRNSYRSDYSYRHLGFRIARTRK